MPGGISAGVKQQSATVPVVPDNNRETDVDWPGPNLVGVDQPKLAGLWRVEGASGAGCVGVSWHLTDLALECLHPVPVHPLVFTLWSLADADPLAFHVSLRPSFVEPWHLITGTGRTPSAPDLAIVVQALIKVLQERGSRHPYDSVKPEAQKSPHHHLMLLSSAPTRHTTTLSSAILLLTFITY